jgi:hypothetical protein
MFKTWTEPFGTRSEPCKNDPIQVGEPGQNFLSSSRTDSCATRHSLNTALSPMTAAGLAVPEPSLGECRPYGFALADGVEAKRNRRTRGRRVSWVDGGDQPATSYAIVDPCVSRRGSDFLPTAASAPGM